MIIPVFLDIALWSMNPPVSTYISRPYKDVQKPIVVHVSPQFYHSWVGSVFGFSYAVFYKVPSFMHPAPKPTPRFVTEGLSCASPKFRPLVAGIEQSETGGYPYIATNVYTLKVYKWPSYKAAYTALQSMIAQHQVFAVGIAQVKTNLFPVFHMSLQKALNPCDSARFVEWALQKNLEWAQGRGMEGTQAIQAAVSAYTSGHLNIHTPQVQQYVNNTMYVTRVVSYELSFDNRRNI